MSWLILNVGGGPTDDKPDVFAAPPQSAHVLTSALNIRVVDVHAIYREWHGLDKAELPRADGKRSLRTKLEAVDAISERPSGVQFRLQYLGTGG